MKKISLLVIALAAIFISVYLVKIDRDLRTMIDRQTGTNQALGHIHEQLHGFEDKIPALAPAQ